VAARAERDEDRPVSEHDLYGPPPEERDSPVARPTPPAPGAAAPAPGPLPEPAPDWPHDGGWAAGPPTWDVDHSDGETAWRPYAEPPPEHHSRNPVDRLTRRLPHRLRIFVDWVVTIAGAVAIVLLVKAYVVNPYRIPSSSMEPTLHCAAPSGGCEARFSDRVLANRFVYHLRDPRRGEIIVFETPPAAKRECGAGGTFVKRLIGLPGEKLEVRLIRGDGYVFINGRRLKEPYILKNRHPVSSFGPVTIKADNYFMMGDNRAASCDSREWGSVPRENLIGKVFATYWPPNRLDLH
jgi:signal peptidase I